MIDSEMKAEGMMLLTRSKGKLCLWKNDRIYVMILIDVCNTQSFLHIHSPEWQNLGDD